MIQLADPKQEYAALRSEIDAAVQEVLSNGQYILGPNVKAFEQEMADYLGCRHAVGVASGTDAIHLVLRALGIGPGDEVITTPFTFVATTEAIALVGAEPVFVDIDPLTLNIDAAQVAAAVGPRTKAILPVHLYGQPCDLKALREIADSHGLQLIEDCAQSLGATYLGRTAGTWGIAGCLSFFPSKNLGCCGDGGMVITNSDTIARRVEILRRHGGEVKYHHTEVGLNSRLDELQAAILRVKLRHLDEWNAVRRRAAYRYNRRLAEESSLVRPAELDHTGPVTPDCAESASGKLCSVYHQYTIRLERRDAVAQQLAESGVGTAVYYPIPLHLQQVHRSLGHAPGAFPVCEQASRTCLSLPMHSQLDDNTVDEVSAVVASCVQKANSGTMAA